MKTDLDFKVIEEQNVKFKSEVIEIQQKYEKIIEAKQTLEAKNSKLRQMVKNE